MNDPSTLAWLLAAVCAALLVLALVGVMVALRRTRQDLERTQAEAAELRARIETLAQRLAPPAVVRSEAAEFLITELGNGPAEPALPVRIEGRLFADIVLRETVVRAASLTHGVRRALAPETRNRIRFEMKRELKRTRKQRRADTKAALREWEARQRAMVDAEPDEDAA